MIVYRRFGYGLIGPTLEGQAVPQELPRNVGKHLPTYGASHARRTKAWAALWPTREISPICRSFSSVFPYYISSPSYPLHFGCLKGIVKGKLKKYFPFELTQLWIWCLFDRASFDNRKIKNQLDATYYFIVLLIGSKCFGHYYVHHQELATMMLITTLVVSFLVCCRLGAVGPE